MLPIFLFSSTCLNLQGEELSEVEGAVGVQEASRSEKDKVSGRFERGSELPGKGPFPAFFPNSEVEWSVPPDSC